MMTMPMRITWLAVAASVGAVVLLAVLLQAGPSAAADFRVRSESTISRTLRFTAAGEHTLDVRAIHGSIHVVGADRSDVQLDARKTARAVTEADLRAAERDVDLDIVEGGARIEAIVLEPEGSTCGDDSDHRTGRLWDPAYVVRFDFTIQVPRGTRLRLCTINGHEILVEGTAGNFELDNVNGRITMTNVRGSGSARTVNGAIAASFSEPPRDASEFKTTNGNVAITLPSDLSADLRMKTFNGGLFTDFDLQTLPQPVPVAERRGDRFVYHSNQFTLVRAGRGGPELTLETFNGNVRVLRAAR
ncbi:MAG TPA: hypothetical protein VI485_08980 [Vicinamibacterales bacterium]|nr:hypothetical protein [Vicinamibacterales bacterium]